MGTKTVPQPPYSPDVAPCDFCLFPKLRDWRYETTEEMKEAVKKVSDTLTQEDFHGAFQKLLERYNKCPYEKKKSATYRMHLVFVISSDFSGLTIFDLLEWPSVRIIEMIKEKPLFEILTKNYTLGIF